jgi:hypothetical protein
MEDDDGICIASLLSEVDVDFPDGGALPYTTDCVLRSSSNLSELSITSSTPTTLAPSASFPNLLDVQSPLPEDKPMPMVVGRPAPKQLLLIEVFCTFNGWIVRIEYPSEENGWCYRADLGGHSSHRWDFSNVMILMARHSTCGRSVFPREMCRNCVMKQIWRTACIDPCNTFYLQAMHTVQACIDALRPIIYEASEATENQSSLYLLNAPKTTVSRKRVSDAESKAARMHKLERALRESVAVANGASLIPEQQSFLAELGSELDKKDASYAMPSIDLSPTVDHSSYFAALSPASPPLLPMPAMVVSPERPISGSLLLPAAAPMLTFLHPPPTRVIGHDAPSAYKAFIELLDFDQNKEKLLSQVMIQTFIADNPQMKTTFSMLGINEKLNRIASKLAGMKKSCQLLIKTVLSDWIGEVYKLSAATCKITIGVGFYAAPSLSVYHDIYRSETLPRFVVNATHRIEHDFKTALSRAHGHPLLVVFHGGAFPMIPGANLLPLGVVHN